MTITLSIPDELYSRVIRLAASQDLSAEQIAISALVEQVGQWERLHRLAASATRESFLAVLAKVPDTTPDPEDALDG